MSGHDDDQSSQGVIGLLGPTQPAREPTPDSLLVFLHGYGASGDDLFGLAGPLSEALPGTAFASPNAPLPSSLGGPGYEWFPVPWIDGASEEAMRSAFAASRTALQAYLDAELERLGLPAERLALLGFSQGAMMALQVGPTRDPGPAAIVGMSGRLADAALLAAERRSAPPIRLIHGELDTVIPIAALEESRQGLESAGLSATTHAVPGLDHGIDERAFELAKSFLVTRLRP